jgi:hypothetical protein
MFPWKDIRACLVYTQISHAKSRARQNFGEGIVRPHFASPRAETGIATKILAGHRWLGFNPNASQLQESTPIIW